MLRARVALVLLALIAIAIAAGCGSNNDQAAAPDTAAGAGAGSGYGASADDGHGHGRGRRRGAAAVLTASGELGEHLVGPNGHTLYLFEKDTGSTSTCTGACAAAWPPLMTTGAPTAGGAADAGLLGTTKRPDGTMEVTYGGHPLYYSRATRPRGHRGAGGGRVRRRVVRRRAERRGRQGGRGLTGA